MHRIFGLLALVAFVVEEFLHQKMRRKNRLPSEPTSEEDSQNTLDRFDVLRLLELLFLSLIVSTVAGQPDRAAGQISIILTGLQTARLFGRKILSRWSVLGVLQALEILLLLILLAVPFDPSGYRDIVITPSAVTALVGGVLYSILITLCSAFSIAYWIKLYSKEFSSTYETFPPLADSQNWACKFASKAVIPGLAAVAGLVFYKGFSVVLILCGASFISCTAGLLAVQRESYTGHHPLAHLFWSLAFLLILIVLVTGVSETGGL